MFYLTTHSTHFIYGYMASDIWLRTVLIVRKETRCRHIGYSLRLTASVLLYAPSTDRIAHTTAFVTPVVEHWLEPEIAQWVHHMKDRSDDLWANPLTTELHLASINQEQSPGIKRELHKCMYEVERPMGTRHRRESWPVRLSDYWF